METKDKYNKMIYWKYFDDVTGKESKFEQRVSEGDDQHFLTWRQHIIKHLVFLKPPMRGRVEYPTSIL